MPRGFAGVREASAAIEAKRGGGGISALWFRVAPEQTTVVRFLEQGDDVAYAMCHEVPVPGRQWGRDVPCLDQEKDGTPCPGCEADLPRRFKGYINVIWDEAPVFKRDGAGKMVKDTQGDPVIVGTKPQVAIWSSGIRLFEDLEEVDANYRGLRSRKFKVKRTGTGFDTKYRIAPADVDAGPQPLSAEEQELEKAKYDLNEHIQPGTYEEFQAEMRGENSRQASPQQQGAPQQSGGRDLNPFLRNRPAA